MDVAKVPGGGQRRPDSLEAARLSVPGGAPSVRPQKRTICPSPEAARLSVAGGSPSVPPRRWLESQRWPKSLEVARVSGGGPRPRRRPESSEAAQVPGSKPSPQRCPRRRPKSLEAAHALGGGLSPSRHPESSQNTTKI